MPRGAKVSEGIKLGHGPRLTSETIQHEGEPVRTLPAEKPNENKSADSVHSNGQGATWNASNQRPTPKVVRVPSNPIPRPVRQTSPERTDALTKKPLDFEEEEETRKLETSRWLESHFGSESSHGSLKGEPEPIKWNRT